MLGALAKKLFGSSNDRRVKGYGPQGRGDQRARERGLALSDEALQARTAGVQSAARQRQATLDDLLVPAFATVREAAKRVLGQRPLRRPAHRRHGAA